MRCELAAAAIPEDSLPSSVKVSTNYNKMRSTEFITEDAVQDLEKMLLKSSDHSYDGIDQLMKVIAKNYSITPKNLHDLFVNHHGVTPDDWIKSKSKDDVLETEEMRPMIEKFLKWAKGRLKITEPITIEFSNDSSIARDGHHTGSYDWHSNKMWVYVKNRNMVDILRTVCHELVHVKQDQEGRIKQKSPPGSKLEREADEISGYMIKLWGAKHHEIFQ